MSDMILHIIKFLVGHPSVRAVRPVGVIEGRAGFGVGPVDSVVRGGFVGHPVVPAEHQNTSGFK